MWLDEFGVPLDVELAARCSETVALQRSMLEEERELFVEAGLRSAVAPRRYPRAGEPEFLAEHRRLVDEFARTIPRARAPDNAKGRTVIRSGWVARAFVRPSQTLSPPEVEN